MSATPIPQVVGWMDRRHGAFYGSQRAIPAAARERCAELVLLSDHAAALAASEARADAEYARLGDLIEAGRRRIAELEAAYLHYRPLAERAEAAEQSLAGAVGLLKLCLCVVSADSNLFAAIDALLPKGEGETS